MVLAVKLLAPEIIPVELHLVQTECSVTMIHKILTILYMLSRKCSLAEMLLV